MLCDREKNGEISFAELEEFLSRGLGILVSEVSDALKQVDTSRTNYMNYGEFNIMMRKLLHKIVASHVI